MKPNPKFTKLPREFWANIRIISQKVGYTQRTKSQERAKRKKARAGKKKTGPIKIPTLAEITAALEDMELTFSHLVGSDGHPTDLGKIVIEYFDFRADVLNNFVEPHLMDKKQAGAMFG